MKPIYIVMLLIGLFILLWHLRGRYASRVASPDIKIIKEYTTIKIVEMPEQILATVRTDGTLASAGSQAFGILAGYIFGDNRSANKIAMTAPVISQAVDGETIAMTAPVTSKEIDTGVYETSFSMPYTWTMETLPIPNNTDIVIKQIPSTRKAVRTFDGYTQHDRIANQRSLFQAALTKEGIDRVGAPTLAQYNDPRTPPRMRRNELRVDTSARE